MKQETCPGESLRCSMAFDSRDWAVDRRDAWNYGIVCGWDEAWTEVAAQHGWVASEVERLKMLHEKFKAAFPERP